MNVGLDEFTMFIKKICMAGGCHSKIRMLAWVADKLISMLNSEDKLISTLKSLYMIVF